jgi:hypothetical protein
VRRKLSLLCLLAAWLCANGVVWNAVQVVGWTKMLSDYSRVMPVTEAIKLTFSGEAPCDFCRVAESGRNQAEQQLPHDILGSAAERILFVADCTPLEVVAATDSTWPGLVAEAGLTRPGAVPVPPPRAA